MKEEKSYSEQVNAKNACLPISRLPFSGLSLPWTTFLSSVFLYNSLIRIQMQWNENKTPMQDTAHISGQIPKGEKSNLPVWTARSPLIVPGSAWRGSVDPINLRADATTPTPSHALLA